LSVSAPRARRGRKARRDGRRGEFIAVLWLMAKGYRIIGFRMKTPLAEIDVLAVKGDVVVVVEVKHRADLGAATQAVSHRQRERLLRAARSLTVRRPDLAGAAVRLDLLALAPGRWPRHIRDAWRET
jgi:putative endonuclease